MTERINVWVQRFKDRPTLMLQWIDPETGKRKSCSAKTDDPKAAEKARGDKEYELNNGLHHSPTKISWEAFRKLFESEYLSGLRERSREKYRSVFDAIEDEMAPKRLADVNERFISKLVARLRVRNVYRNKPKESEEAGPKKKRKVTKVGLEPVSIKNYLVLLHRAMTWGKDQKLVTNVPKFPQVKVAKKKPQPIPAEAFERLVGAENDPQWKAFLLTAWWSGLRLNEAWQLRRTQTTKAPYLDLDAGRIVLPAVFVKAGQDQWVPLHSELRKVLESLPGDEDRLFAFRSQRGNLMSRSAVSARVCRIAKKAGVRLSMHKLRKGFGCRVASTLGKSNAPVLHTLMRHSSMQITMDYYANVDDVLTEAIEQIR